MNATVNSKKHIGLAVTQQEWFAVYTRYKREKIVKKELERKGIQCYLPLQKFTRHYTRKIKKVELPLISCYVFVQIERTNYVPVLEVSDVVDFVKFSNKMVAIPEREITIMKRVVGEITEIEVQEGIFLNGDQVEVIGGQLTGLKGVLIEQRNDKNFVIELENLGYSLLIQIDPKYLKKVRF